MKTKLLFQRIALVVLLAVISSLQGFAATYYAKAIAKVSSSGGGKVFVSTTNSSANAVWDESSEATKTSTSTFTTNTFYLFAQADEGYEFDHWATADNSATSASKNNPWSYGFRCTSQNSASPTTNTRYAVFKKKQNYYSALTANASEGGKVFVNITNSSADAVYATSSIANQTTEGTSAPSHNYYLFAQPEDGYEFVGWATTADGNVTSKNNPYNAKVTANSNNSEAPTAATYYAKFAKAELHYSKTTATAQTGGDVFVSTTNSSADAVWAATSTASNSTFALEAPTHTYYYFAKAQDSYEFRGWMEEGSETVISTNNPYTGTVTANSKDEAAPATKNLVAKFVTAQPHYSKVTVGLNAANDLGTKKLGGKLYVGKTAEEAASGLYEYTSEASIMTYSVDDAVHEYYLYAQPEEGFTFAGWQTSQTSISTSYNSTDNPYLYKVTATSTDSENPTAKAMYARFNYIEKPAKVYAAGVVKAIVIEEDGTTRVDAKNSGCMVGITDEANATTCSAWAEDIIQGATQEGDTPASASTNTYIHFTAFAKAGLGYEFKGFASSKTGNPTATTIAQGETGYYHTSNTRQQFSNTMNTPGAMGLEDAPKQKIVYAFFQKLVDMPEPTGETTVQVTEVKGTTSLAEGEVTKDFTVDLVLNEQVPYDKPGSDKNAKPSEVLKQFVTVTGANGNKATVTNYSLVYESKDLGENSDGLSIGTAYTCNTLRLSFPYNIKADTYTVHLPYGLYTTVNGNKTPTYEFTITVTEATSTSLTVKSVFPTEGMTIKYRAATQTATPDAEKGEFEKSNITASVTFNEVVESIDESKKDGIVLQNTTAGVNYKPTNVIRNAAMFGKVSGEVSIAYPELVNGSYTLTIPEGLFVGNGKVNEAMTINFTVSGFSVQLKPYEMITDQVTPKSDLQQKLEKLQDIAISYKGEFGDAKALVGNASGITIKGFTETHTGEGEGAKVTRNYYDVTTTPSAKVEDGKLIVSFTPALTASGLYEVTIPAGLAANMEPGEMTMADKVNAGYAINPLLSLAYNVESPVVELEVPMSVSAAKYGTFIAPFDVEIPAGVTASKVLSSNNGTLVLDALSTTIPANTPVVLQSEEVVTETFKGEVASDFNAETTYIEGLLVGVYEDIKAPVGSYVLQKQNNKVAFYIVKAEVGQPSILAYRCYLSEGAAAGAPALYFVEDDATAIDGFKAEIINAGSIYNVNGARVSSLQKGLNIIKTANGTKKVVIK